MEKKNFATRFKDFIREYMPTILVIVLVISIFRGCGVSQSAKRSTKATNALAAKVDSLSVKLDAVEDKVLSDTEVANLIRTTRATQTLIDEELIDKKQLSLTDLYKDLK